MSQKKNNNIKELTVIVIGLEDNKIDYWNYEQKIKLEDSDDYSSLEKCNPKHWSPQIKINCTKLDNQSNDFAYLGISESIFNQPNSVCFMRSAILVPICSPIWGALHSSFLTDSDKEYETDDKHVSIGQEIYRNKNRHVYRGKFKGEDVVLKKFDKKDSPLFENEIKAMKKTSHCNILLFKGFFSKNEELYIITEWCNDKSLHRNLYELKIQFSIHQCINLSKQIANGMNYLHTEKNIIHRDLKSPNILLDNSITKIGDFELSIVRREIDQENECDSDFCGTYIWMSPEMILRKKISFKSDVYSYGIVLFELFSGKLPYENYLRDGCKEAIIYNVGIGKLKPDLNECKPGTPNEIKELILDCIRFEKNERPSFNEILNRLNQIL